MPRSLEGEIVSKIFFDQDDITINEDVANFGGAVYPMRIVTGVTTSRKIRKSRAILGAILTFFGAVLAYRAPPLGFFVFAIGIMTLRTAFRELTLVLNTAQGDLRVFNSKNRSLINEAKAAIEIAILRQN